MTASEDIEPNTTTLAERIADVASAHPCVLRLDAGQFDMTSTPLADERVLGVRVPESGASIEVAVVLRLERPLPEIVTELRGRIRAVTGPVPVNITVSDVVVTSSASSATEEPTG